MINYRRRSNYIQKAALILAAAWAANTATAKAAASEEEILCPPMVAGKADSKTEKVSAQLRKRIAAIAKGDDINATDKRGQTALMYAAATNNKLAACWLVAKGADATLKSNAGKTAADIAKDPELQELLSLCATTKVTPSTGSNDYIFAGYLFHHITLQRLAQGIAERGADPKTATDALGGDGWCDSIRAAKVAFLVRHGYDATNAKIGCTLEPDAVRLLLALGWKQEDENTRLLTALILNDLPTIKAALEARPDIAQKGDKKWLRACHSAEAVGLFLQAGLQVQGDVANDLCAYPAMYHPEALRALFESCGDVRSITSNQSSPLSAYMNYDDISHTREIIKTLIKLGFNKQEELDDALKNAAANKNLSALSELIKAGANPKQPQILAKTFICDSTDGIDKDQMTRLPATLDILIKNGADINDAAKNENFIPTSDQLPWKQEQFSVIEEAIMNMSYADTYRTFEGIRVLVKAGAKMPKDALSLMLSGLSINGGHTSSTLNEKIMIATDMVEAGADINSNCSCYAGETFLDYICRQGTWDEKTGALLEKFIQKGAKLDSALNSARKNKNEPAIKFLESHGAK